MSRTPFMEPAKLRSRRAAQRRRRARRRLAVLALGVALVLTFAVTAVESGRNVGGGTPSATAGSGAAPVEAPAGQTALGPLDLRVDLSSKDRVHVPFHKPPRAGLLVNLDTGEVLWRRNPERSLPIASLTKMMTALVTVDALRPDDKAQITSAVLSYSGSGVGVLPRGKRVKVETLLYGLMLPSGNDAARALAFRTSGSLRGFVAQMNERAARMGLKCTQYAGVEGLSPRNRSCAADLAVIARQLLDNARLARIVRHRRAVLPFPIKGGRIHLYNNNPLLRQGYPGLIGVKTGYTDPAGLCLVAAAKRHGVRLAAIVLHSPNPGDQARKLLDRGFQALR